MRLAGTLKHHHVDTHLLAHLVRLLSLLTIHRLIISQLSVYSVVQLTAHWWPNEVTQGNHSDANFQVNLQNHVIPAALWISASATSIFILKKLSIVSPILF